ncbi:MAG: hypothetical protein KTR14_02655 [Vampirovibrio sp.]|nr:hypothetical protein [Vampirovibrio sp.]
MFCKLFQSALTSAFSIVLLFMCFSSVCPPVWAQQFEENPAHQNNSISPSQTYEEKAPETSKKQVLQGGISTLQGAIEQEAGLVDWYGWYLKVRAYLRSTGGFQCSVGTPIRFYKGGKVEAKSSSLACVRSAAIKYFPLPKETKLKAVVFPVRGPKMPAATPEEVEYRVNRKKYRTP